MLDDESLDLLRCSRSCKRQNVTRSGQSFSIKYLIFIDKIVIGKKFKRLNCAFCLDVNFYF